MFACEVSHVGGRWPTPGPGWIRSSIRDLTLARQVGEIEQEFRGTAEEKDGVDRVRTEVVRAVEERYLG